MKGDRWQDPDDGFWRKSLWGKGRHLGLSRRETVRWWLRLKFNTFAHAWTRQMHLTRRAWTGSSGWMRLMIAFLVAFLVLGAFAMVAVVLAHAVVLFALSVSALWAGAWATQRYEGALERERFEREHTRTYLRGLIRRDVQ